MSSFASSSLRLLRRLLHVGSKSATAPTGPTVVLDGASAVAAVEAAIGEAAALGAGWPAATAARAWSRIEHRKQPNAIASPLTGIDADGPREALSAAIGLAASGQRATVFLSGSDLAACIDLLQIAVGRRLPLVIHVACRAAAGHAVALGTGHESLHAAADTGCIQLFATNAQEAVDFALAARRAAELALVPAIVAMDGCETAVGVQEVALPAAGLIREYLGLPWDAVPAPTEAQRMLFGDARRRVPRQFDLDRPMLLSPLEGPESWALGAAGARPFFADPTTGLLDQALSDLAERTGRRSATLLEQGQDSARIVLIALGSAVETATAVAERMRTDEKAKVGVLGLRRLQPWPRARVANALKDATVVAVLERTDASLSGEGPLARQVRATLDTCAENGRFGKEAHPGYPTISSGRSPRLVSVPYGLGGAPLRAADLRALFRELATPHRSLAYLGISFAKSDSVYPKRQALIDTLRRSHPDIESLGLVGDGPPPELRPKGAVTIAIQRPAGRAYESIAGDAAGLLHELFGEHIRSRAGLTWQRYDEPCTDVLTFASEPLRDPGDDVPVDIAIAATTRGANPIARLADGGALLIQAGSSAQLTSGAWSRLRSKNVSVFTTNPGDDAPQDMAQPWAAAETLLGGLLSLYVTKSGATRPTAAKARAAREAALGELSDEQREQRLAVFEQAYGSLTPVERTDRTDDAPAADLPTPRAVRRLARADQMLDSLPRFWDQVGVLYRSGKTNELGPDPYLAAGAVPPLSAEFRDVSPTAKTLPAFDPATCDGNGTLWTTCPDGSIAPLVISVRTLIDAGLEMASARGAGVDELRGVVAPLAKVAHKAAKTAEQPGMLAGDLLRDAFATLAEKSNFDADRRASLEQSLGAVVDAIGDLPLARTRPFFDDAEKEAAGSGELFALFVNPDACKSAELLLAAGQGHGLTAVEANRENIDRARRLWDLWLQLPDTSGDTIERARKHADVGPLAAIMLSRHCLHAMSAGDGAEAGSGAKLALRQVLAAAEYHLQPRLQQYLQRIEELRGRIAARIREVMADSLPAGDLDVLAEGLDVLGRTDVDLTTFSAKIDEAVTGGRVDGALLGRLVDCGRGLADLQQRLTSGPSGLGRARISVTLASDSVAQWAAAFPHNPFAGPAAVDAGGETGALARGLIEGQLRQAIAAVRVLRWATLELDKPKEAARAVPQLDHLRFDDLSDEERALCPPMLVVGDGRTFGGHGLSQLSWMLGSGLPIKVLVLGGIGGEADGGLNVESLGGFPAGQRVDVGLLALLNREAFVLQTSLATPDHFIDGATRALAFDGPALIHVHAPSPERHGFATEHLFNQARLALESRAMPVFTFDPTHAGVFGSRLDITANPAGDSSLVETGDGRKLTPIDWAASEARFSEHFEPLPSDAPTPTAVSDFLALSDAERANRTPFVTIRRGDAEHRLHVGKMLIADADRRLRLWQTLQELAGVVTPFTEQVREQAKRDVASAHAAEIEKLRSEYEAKLVEQEESFAARATQKVTRRLMQIAGYDPSLLGGGGNGS